MCNVTTRDEMRRETIPDVDHHQIQHLTNWIQAYGRRYVSVLFCFDCRLASDGISSHVPVGYLGTHNWRHALQRRNTDSTSRSSTTADMCMRALFLSGTYLLSLSPRHLACPTQHHGLLLRLPGSCCEPYTPVSGSTWRSTASCGTDSGYGSRLMMRVGTRRRLRSRTGSLTSFRRQAD